MMSAVVSVRVKRELKEEAERLGIDLRRLVEKTLEEEVERRKRARFEEAIDTIVQGMNAVSEEEFVRVVKEWRRKRM
ncbi:type II toxin-antitoxin system CcdA family antitoxin [Candidatus Bathyarchaeota archaeon]|nr:type II toxin-antitoxin system CcdA family antitoxin [Candidatus Bathyarchaeota archaeon]